MKHFDPAARGPLSGLKVVDISRLVAGNMTSLQLGDFGAEVIKVEPPEGDPLRAWRDGGHELFWKTYARNKRSIVLNLRADEAREALRRILDTADVFIENFRPGTLEAMELDPPRLHARNPGLVILRISGFGQTGPYAERPGFGTLIEAMSGFASRTGFADREPVLPPLALADMVSGLYGAMATAFAIRSRDAGMSQGQVIDLSLLEPLVSVLGPDAAIFKLTGKIKPRIGSASSTTAPRNVYRCGDGGYIALAGSTQKMADRVFEAIGRNELAEDPRFVNNTARVKNRTELDQIVGGWFAGRTRDEALAIMRAADVTVGPVYDIRDAVSDEHFQERGIYVEAEDADLGPLPMHNIVPRLSETPGVWRRPAPKLGEHSREILAEAGYDDDAIDRLTAQGAST